VRWARPGCWGLHHAWDARGPHDLLSVAVSLARPPHPAGASGPWQAPWWAAPAPERFAVRPPPPPERPPPASPARACSVSASRDAPALSAPLLRGVLPFPSTATAPAAAGGREPPSRSAGPGSAPGPSAPETPGTGHGRAESAASPRPSRGHRRGGSDAPPGRCRTRQRWCRARVGSGSGPPGRRLPGPGARPATRQTPSHLTQRSCPPSLAAGGAVALACGPHPRRSGAGRGARLPMGQGVGTTTLSAPPRGCGAAGGRAGPAGSAPRRSCASGLGPSPGRVNVSPGAARPPWPRWLTRVRSRVAVNHARGSGQRSASATLGTCTTLQTCFAPACERRSMVRRWSPSSRAVLARR
jgi:hypothetical protein